MTESESVTLPLGDAPRVVCILLLKNKLAGAAGLERTNHGVKVRCLTDLAMPLRWGE